MAKVFFVTGSAGQVGYLQHWGALRKSIGRSSNALNTSSTTSVKVIASTTWKNHVHFQLKTRHNRPHYLWLPALPERENQNMRGETTD
jgi:hypothetical protein